MGAIDLNRVAVCMGKVIKLLADIQPKIRNGNDVYDYKEDFCCIAYMCRIGILDRIENNSYMRNPNVPIRIPTGLFSSKKETIAGGLYLTVGKLKELVSKDVVTESYIEDILNRHTLFYEFESSLPVSFKRSL